MKKAGESSSLTRELVYQLLDEKKPNQKERVILKTDTIRTCHCCRNESYLNIKRC